MDTEGAVFRYIRNLILYFMKKTLLIVILPAAGRNVQDQVPGETDSARRRAEACRPGRSLSVLS